MNTSRPAVATAMLGLVAATALTPAQALAFSFADGDLLVSSSTYTGTASSVTVGQALPGGGNAVANGTYPYVFNNASVDASFGITSPLYINQFSLSGTQSAPTITANGVYNVTANTGIATSFSSKSEGALNLSPDGHTLTFMDYLTTPNKLDVSNANTPGITEPGNYTQNATARAIVSLNANAQATVLPTNAYPGNNPRAVIDVNGNYYSVGNAGNANGSAQVTAANGVQILNPNTATTTAGDLNTTKVGTFSVAQTNPATGQPYATPTQLSKDKPAKDDNYRGEAIYNNTLYVTKGSGSNGINTVYQVGAAGTLPSSAGNATINVLPGFPATLARAVTVVTGNSTGTNTNPTGLNVAIPTGKVDAGFYPFGLFFANSRTLYVADEGDGTVGNSAKDIEAGLQKWSLVNGSWHYDYTLQSGLNLGTQYSISNGPNGEVYPVSLDPATDGLRNITGKVNADGTVTIYGITSTVSASGDQGADPNKLVAITDTLADTTSAQVSGEGFTTLETAGYGQVLRGVSFAPVPEPATLALMAAGLGGLGLVRRRR